MNHRLLALKQKFVDVPGGGRRYADNPEFISLSKWAIGDIVNIGGTSYRITKKEPTAIYGQEVDIYKV